MVTTGVRHWPEIYQETLRAYCVAFRNGEVHRRFMLHQFGPNEGRLDMLAPEGYVLIPRTLWLGRVIFDDGSTL